MTSIYIPPSKRPKQTEEQRRAARKRSLDAGRRRDKKRREREDLRRRQGGYRRKYKDPGQMMRTRKWKRKTAGTRLMDRKNLLWEQYSNRSEAEIDRMLGIKPTKKGPNYNKRWPRGTRHRWSKGSGHSATRPTVWTKGRTGKTGYGKGGVPGKFVPATPEKRKKTMSRSYRGGRRGPVRNLQGTGRPMSNTWDLRNRRGDKGMWAPGGRARPGTTMSGYNPGRYPQGARWGMQQRQRDRYRRGGSLGPSVKGGRGGYQRFGRSRYPVQRRGSHIDPYDMRNRRRVGGFRGFPGQGGSGLPLGGPYQSGNKGGGPNRGQYGTANNPGMPGSYRKAWPGFNRGDVPRNHGGRWGTGLAGGRYGGRRPLFGSRQNATWDPRRRIGSRRGRYQTIHDPRKYGPNI